MHGMEVDIVWNTVCRGSSSSSSSSSLHGGKQQPCKWVQQRVSEIERERERERGVEKDGLAEGEVHDS